MAIRIVIQAPNRDSCPYLSPYLEPEGAVHSAVRNALKTGISKEEIMHVGILAITTIGLPHALAAMTWIKDLLESS